MKVHWKFLAESRLRMPLKKFFEREGVTTYEEAVEALGRFKQPVGSPEEVAPFLPTPSEKSGLNSDSGSSTSSRSSRRTQEILSSSKKKEPSSAAEAAADAITKSKAVKSPQSTQKKRSSRKRKST